MSERLGPSYGLPDHEAVRNHKAQQEFIHEREVVRRQLGGLCVVEIPDDPQQIYGRPYKKSSHPGKVWVLAS